MKKYQGTQITNFAELYAQFSNLLHKVSEQQKYRHEPSFVKILGVDGNFTILQIPGLSKKFL